MEYGDKIFNLINGLPVPDEPKHTSSGPSEAGAFAKFHEQIVLDHHLGKTSAPAFDVGADELIRKLLAPRDSRDVPGEKIAPQFRKAADDFEPMPHSDDSLAKRYTPSTHDSDGEEELVEEYSHGRVIAKLRDGVVVSTRYEAR